MAIVYVKSQEILGNPFGLDGKCNPRSESMLKSRDF
jgi:hypothetical protein